MSKLIYSLLALLLLSTTADAASLRMRARENFDTGVFNAGTGNVRMQGFSSAFNLWWEEPFRSGYGLTFHRGRLTQAGTKHRSNLTSVGIEWKVFPLAISEPADGKPIAGFSGLWFARSGLLSSALDPGGPVKAAWVHGITLGTGLELPIGRIGLAPEIGTRLQYNGGAQKRIVTFYTAIGIHFYMFGSKPG
jgi:hypothetical protein